MAGGRTRWAGLVSGATVLLFLPFAGVLAPLPKAVLAVIVILAVAQLVKTRPLLSLLRISTPQALVGWAAFVMTLALAPHIEQALILSVVLSLGVHVWREVTPGYRVSVGEGELHLELSGVLWFGSAPILGRELLGHLEEAEEVSRVVVDLSGLGRIDVTGALLLREIREDVQQAGMSLVLTNVPDHAQRILSRVLGGNSPWGDRSTSEGGGEEGPDPDRIPSEAEGRE
jgi:SulP family sulfate permease